MSFQDEFDATEVRAELRCMEKRNEKDGNMISVLNAMCDASPSTKLQNSIMPQTAASCSNCGAPRKV